VTNPQGGAKRVEIKQFWYTAGALGLITTVLTVVLTTCAQRASNTAATSTTQTPTTTTTVAAPPTTSAESTTTATTTASAGGSGFRKEPVSPLRVPYPSCYTYVDLDGPRVTEDTDDTDLMYQACSDPGTLAHFSHSAVGVGPANEPANADECSRAANAQALSTVARDDLVVGAAFCVVTDRGNIVWLKLTQRLGKQDSADLAFDIVRWLR
jgi:hypothetical protein